MEKLSKEQKLRIYCVKHGHANYVTKFWGYVYCGRCGTQLGDQLAGIYDTTHLLVVGCKDKNCKVCKPLYKKLNKMDKKIYDKLLKEHNHEV